MKETYILSAPSLEDSVVTISYEKRKAETKIEDGVYPKSFTYEEAISAAGFGKFNILLIILTIPSGVASICATTAISYILAESQCDLNLTLDDKGMLNAITYIGMICSTFLWGMIGDTYGRKTVLVYSYSLDTIICIIGTFSQTKHYLLAAKFFSGFMMNGPITVLMCYLSEFHTTTFRPQLITILGVNYSVSRTILPLLAWAILPLKLHFVLFNGLIDYKSWQIYLAILCIPSALAGISHYYLPETPKFLMTKGKFDEAMELFKKIYVLNTGKPANTLPFSELTDTTYVEKSTPSVDTKNVFKLITEFMKLLKPMFTIPYVWNTFLMAGVFFGSLLGGNTLRLWLPQMFTTMDEYMQAHANETVSTICEMLNYTAESKNISYNEAECKVPDVTDDVYINNTIVPVCSIAGYFIIAGLVRKVGKKFLLVTQYLLAACLIIGNYWATNTMTTVILTSLYLTFYSICSTTATATAVEIYPTNLRAMASSIFLLAGRTGSILGNTLFPFLLYSGCLPPFLFIGGFMLICALFSLLLPGTENKPLR